MGPKEKIFTFIEKKTTSSHPVRDPEVANIKKQTNSEPLTNTKKDSGNEWIICRPNSMLIKLEIDIIS